MSRMIVQRLFISILVILGALTLVFFILHLLPGDPVNIRVAGNPVSPEMIASLNHEFGLDRPLIVQYLSYMWNAVRGDFGKSLVTHEAVLPKLLEQFPATLYLTLFSTLIAVVVGISLGVISAVYRNRWIDYVIRVISLFGISMPAFWSAILLVLIFSVNLTWFPSTGVGGFKYLVLPATTLGILGGGFIIRLVRNSVLEVISEQFVITLRSKGLTERVVMYQHVLRNALIPAVTMIGMLVGELLAGAVVIETVFARQGIGRVIVDAIMNMDLPVVQGAVLITAFIYLLVNLLVDISYGLIDPRVRETQ